MVEVGLNGAGLGLLGQEDGLDVRKNSALSDGDAGQQLVQLLVVADGQLKVARDDARLLVVLGSVSGQFQDLGGEVPDVKEVEDVIVEKNNLEMDLNNKLNVKPDNIVLQKKSNKVKNSLENSYRELKRNATST